MPKVGQLKEQYFNTHSKWKKYDFFVINIRRPYKRKLRYLKRKAKRMQKLNIIFSKIQKSQEIAWTIYFKKLKSLSLVDKAGNCWQRYIYDWKEKMVDTFILKLSFQYDNFHQISKSSLLTIKRISWAVKENS